MKRKYVTVVLMAGMLGVMLGACGGNPGMMGETMEGTQNGETAGSSGEAGTAGNEAGSGENANNNKDARSLNDEELQAFTDYINEGDDYANYGFLLSVYDTPADIDLNQLFYNGAGIAEQPLSEDEAKEYLAVTGQEEIYTDITRIEPEKMDAFLQEKTGLTYEKMNRPLDWTYLEKYDIYCAEHGDTNYQAFTCVAGSTSDEQTFTLRFQPDLSYLGGDMVTGYYQPDYELVVEKNGDGYRFLSNRLVTEERQIKEQTFPVTVAEYGDVTFATYEPNYDLNPQADVTFMLLSKEGEIIQTLSGVYENNIRAAVESYESVEAVSFLDYNGDGYMDAITITNYSYIQGPDVGEGFAEVRVYSGSEYGYLYYEKDVSDIINAEMEAPTIQKVRDFLSGINYYGTWKITGCAGTTPVYALSEDEIAAYTGTTVSYTENGYGWNGGETWIPGYSIAQKTQDSFREEFGVALPELGVQAEKIVEVTAESREVFGNSFFVVDKDTLLILWDGVFFAAERVE